MVKGESSLNKKIPIIKDILEFQKKASGLVEIVVKINFSSQEFKNFDYKCQNYNYKIKL